MPEVWYDVSWAVVNAIFLKTLKAKCILLINKDEKFKTILTPKLIETFLNIKKKNPFTAVFV